MDARQSRRGKRISLQQEKRAAADLGGRTMAASGATRMGGGADVRVMGKIRLECKFTEKDVYVLKESELAKLRKQATKALEYPVFQFAYRDPSGRLEQFAVIGWDEKQPPVTEWETEKKSMSFERTYLRNAIGHGLLRIVFHVRGVDKLKSKYYRVMTWDEYLERQGQNA